jgi:hypothetical protein
LSEKGYIAVPFEFPKLNEFSTIGTNLMVNYGLFEVVKKILEEKN